MSDGAGVVEAVGEAWLSSGQETMSFPASSLNGRMGYPVDQCATSPARQAIGIDGFAAHFSVRAATAFTHAPRGWWSHAEAATLPRPVSLRGGRWSRRANQTGVPS